MCVCRALRCESALSYGGLWQPSPLFPAGTECSLILLHVSSLSSPGLKKKNNHFIIIATGAIAATTSTTAAAAAGRRGA